MKLRLPSFLLLALAAIRPASPLLAARLVLSGADFHTVDGSGQYVEVADGSIVGHGGPGGTCLVAGVDLPDGAILTNMRVRYLDNDATNFSLDLLRKRRGNSTLAASVAFVDTSGASASVQEANATWIITAPVNAVFTYYLSTRVNCLDSASHRIYAVTIDYVDPIFADGFESGDTTAWGTTPSSLRWKLVSGPQFRPESEVPGYSEWGWLINPDLGTYEERNSTGFSGCGIAPVELPDGVTVNGFIANVYDGRTDRGLTLTLRGKLMSSSGAASVVATASTSPSTGWQMIADLGASHVINNSQRWYYLDICVTGGTTVDLGDLQTQAVQILYRLP